MNTDELKIKSFFEERKREEELQKDFIIHQGYTAFGEILKEVKSRGSLNEEDVYYGIPKPQLSFSEVELGYMLTSMMEYATNHVGNPVDEKSKFENKLAFFEHEKEILQIYEAIVQGTDSWFEIPDEETIDKLSNTAYGVYLFQFDDFINHYKNKVIK